MKRSIILFFLAALTLFCAALSEALVIPGGIVSVEEEAFGDIASFSSVVIPADVSELDPSAFSSAVTTIYGVTGSAAERFAAQTQRRFVAIDININALNAPAWVAPGTEISLLAEATSPVWPLEYRYQLERDGEIIMAGDWLSQPLGKLTIASSGVFDVRVFVRSEWLKTSRLFPAAITVGGAVRFAADPLRVYVGQETPLLAAEETRLVSIVSDQPALLAISGANATGLKAGACTLTATAVQPEGTVVTTVPVEVCIAVQDIAIDHLPARLFPGDEVTLSARVLPANASYPQIAWSSSDESVFAVDALGVLTARQPGEAILWADVDGARFSFPLRVTMPIALIDISPEEPGALLLSGGTLRLKANVLPASADAEAILWVSTNPQIASVSADGTVSGLAVGQAVIYCLASDGSGARGEFAVSVAQGVESLALGAPTNLLFAGETLSISASLSPANALGTTLAWASSDESIATVDQSGCVRPVGAGLVTISASAENGKRAALTLRVYSASMPTAFVMDNSILYLNVGESYALTFTTQPNNAVSDAIWLSSNTSVVTVDASGKITANSSGTAILTVTSAVDASVSVSRTVTVLNPSRTLIMPARQTKTGGITANLNKIAAVKSSAYEELDALYAQKKLSSSVLSARKSVISKAFSMYSFPWMTPSYQEYWKAANSENGAKDFKPGIVYYGLPYISTGYYYQRLYDVSKAVSENRYTKSGSYYLLNQDNLYNGKYCGNDCSSMVAMSYFGSSPSVVGNWNTHLFYNSSDFVTLSKSAVLYPGDILVRDYHHVVMFLYYANSAHTQIVVIEQGGSEPGINTLSTSVYNLSSFLNNGYIPRRYSSW